jgi:hypothetical protein
MPTGCVGVAVARVVGGTDVGVAVAGGVSGAWVHPAKTRSRVTTDRIRIRENFFIHCSIIPHYIMVSKCNIHGEPPVTCSARWIGLITSLSFINRKKY